MATPLITLTTDFGSRDGYVAAMKGVILGICPDASIVDISHDIEPQDVAQAALVLSFAAPYFPAHAIHVAVVDPEVGSDRRPLLLTAMSGRYVGPDNGIFTHVLAEFDLVAPEMPVGDEAVPVEAQLPGGCAAFILDRPKFRRSPLSRTFHARDLFAPVAAHLALGTSPEELGTETDYYNVLPLPRPRLAIIGSHGYLEVAWWRDSAARKLGAKVGTPVTVLEVQD